MRAASVPNPLDCIRACCVRRVAMVSTAVKLLSMVAIYL